ncbi:phosphoribosyl-AMP cyclohydrolase, partial [Aquiluna sp.]|nr:phosphoribosyl-AMP cyclohydrolase [Aquiluna sp.]
ETSGNFLHVSSISVDCDKDALVAMVHPDGPTCHLGNTSCFEAQS